MAIIDACCIDRVHLLVVRGRVFSWDDHPGTARLERSLAITVNFRQHAFKLIRGSFSMHLAIFISLVAKGGRFGACGRGRVRAYEWFTLLARLDTPFSRGCRAADLPTGTVLVLLPSVFVLVMVVVFDGGTSAALAAIDLRVLIFN